MKICNTIIRKIKNCFNTHCDLAEVTLFIDLGNEGFSAYGDSLNLNSGQINPNLRKKV